MASSQRKHTLMSTAPAGLTLLSLVALIGGTVNLVRARDISQSYLRSHVDVPNMATVGLPSEFAAAIGALGAFCLCVALFALWHHFWSWARLAALGSVVVCAVLWYDTHVVSSIRGIAESTAPANNYPWGVAASAVNMAGWFFFAAIALSLIGNMWLRDPRDTSDETPAHSSTMQPI